MRNLISSRLILFVFLVVQTWASISFAVANDCSFFSRIKQAIKDIRDGGEISPRQLTNLQSRMGLREGDQVKLFTKDGIKMSGRFVDEDDKFIYLNVNNKRVPVIKSQLDLDKTQRITSSSASGRPTLEMRANTFSQDKRSITISDDRGKLRTFMPTQKAQWPGLTSGDWVRVTSQSGGLREGEFVMETSDYIIVKLDGKLQLLNKVQLKNVKTATPSSVRKNLSDVREIYKTQDSARFDGNSSKVLYYTMPNGKRIETTVKNTAQVRGLGGPIREFSVGEPPNLEPGSYTFAIFRDGHMAAAKVENSWEVGAKHLQIVKDPKTLVPREAVAAGELRIHADGSYDWNDSSGSVTRPLSFTAKPEDIRTRTDAALELLLKQRGQYAGVDSKLLPSRQPTYKEIMRYCTDQNFLSSNQDLCRKLLGGR